MRPTTQNVEETKKAPRFPRGQLTQIPCRIYVSRGIHITAVIHEEYRYDLYGATKFLVEVTNPQVTFHGSQQFHSAPPSNDAFNEGNSEFDSDF